MAADDHHDDGHSELTSEQSLKVAAIFIVLIAGYVGSITPYLIAYFTSSKDDDEENRKKKHRRVQIAMKILTCISIGVIIATVLIHLLPHGVSELKESGNALFMEVHEEEEHHDESTNTTNSTNSTDNHDEEGHEEHPYPFAYLFAMVAFFVVFFVSTEINWYGVRKLKELKGTNCDPKEEAYLSGMIKLWTMEIGIFIHSIVVGITLGVANNMTDVRTLTIVLVFHQIFEGLAIGSMTVTTNLSFWKAFGFQSLFAFAVPVGIAIGLGVEHKTDAVTRGVFVCLGAGVLLYTGCVEMLPHLFGSHEHHAHGPLPLAELHQRVHEASADADNNTSPDAIKEEGDHPLKAVKTGDEEEETNNNKKEAADVPTAEVAASSSAEHSHHNHNHELNDDHTGDDSFAMRLACYIALLFGATVQSALGVWA